MEEKIKIGILFGIYGKLLTEKQYELLNDYYNNDLSLSEIAENNNITRQAVNDVINKGKNKIIEIEEKLAFMKKMLNQEKEIKLIINELKNGLKVAKTYGSDSFYDNWEKHYNSRTSKLIAINDIKKIEVSEKNQSILDELLASGKEVQTKNKNEDTIKSFADSLTFTLDEANSDESASYYIYTATAENTTQLNFEYLSLNIKLIDDQGTTVDTQPIYESNWAANEKRNLEFTTDKTFSTIQITVNDYSLED